MRKLLTAAEAGFCFGVQRAIGMAEDVVKEQKVFSLGPLIHNRQEVERLEKLGVISVGDEIPSGLDGVVLIRTHGVVPDIYRQLREKGLSVIDATCPFVRKAQQLAEKAAEDGCQVIILGDKDHPEVIGLKGWAKERALVVKSRCELENVKLSSPVAVLVQTTERKENLEQLVAYLQERVEEVRVYDTICGATGKRQQAAAELAPNVEAMIVIGGKNSSNTRKLWDICKKLNSCTYLIEEADELEESWFLGKNIIGVTAGASTPDWIIKEVIKRMEDMKEPEIQREESMEEKEMTVTETQASENENAGMDEKAELTGEKEITSMDELDFHNFQPGELVKGKVVKIMGDEVLVEIGGKSEGIIPVEELAYRKIDPQEAVTLGEEIVVEVIKEDKEGNIILSRKNALVEESLNKLEESLENGVIIEAPVIEAVKGGLLVDVGIRGFIPASHVGLHFVEDLSQYLRQNLKLKVLELDKKNRRAVLSHKLVLQEEQKQKKEQLWAEIEEGQVRQGVVKRLTNFGAFVDIGGIDGLLHVSEMSWRRVANPAEVVKEGDNLEVEIIKIDREKHKVSLSLKKLLKNPWELVAEKYAEGQIITGKVTHTVPFGAFVEIEPGMEGLVHISQISANRIKQVEDAVSAGQTVTAKIIEINPEKKRISLSMKEIAVDADQAELKDFMDKQEGEGQGVTIGEALQETQENKE